MDVKTFVLSQLASGLIDTLKGDRTTITPKVSG